MALGIASMVGGVFVGGTMALGVSQAQNKNLARMQELLDNNAVDPSLIPEVNAAIDRTKKAQTLSFFPKVMEGVSFISDKIGIDLRSIFDPVIKATAKAVDEATGVSTSAFPARASEPTTRFPSSAQSITGGIEPETGEPTSGLSDNVSAIVGGMRSADDLKTGPEVAGRYKYSSDGQNVNLDRDMFGDIDTSRSLYGGSEQDLDLLQQSRIGNELQDISLRDTMGTGPYLDRDRRFNAQDQFEAGRRTGVPLGTDSIAYNENLQAARQRESELGYPVPTGLGQTQVPTNNITQQAASTENQLQMGALDNQYSGPNMRGSYQGNIPPSNMQGTNFTPDSIDPRGPSQIPDSLTPFPAVNRQLVGTQPVGTKMLPNVGGTSGRQNVITQDMFPPMTYNTQPYDERNESVYGTGAKVNPATNFVQNERMMYNRPADTGNYSVNTFADQPQTFPSEMQSILESGVQTPVSSLQAGASDFNQDAFNSLIGTQPTSVQEFPELTSGLTVADQTSFPIGAYDNTGLTTDSGMGGAIQSGQSPVPINTPSVLPSVFASESPTGMGRAIQDQQKRRESTLGQMTTPQYQPSVEAAKAATATLPSYEKGFGTVTPDKFNNLVPGQDLEPEFLRDAEGNFTTTRNPRAGMSFEYDINDPKSRTEANAKLNFFSKTGKARPEYILAGGRKVDASSALAQNDAENTASGYTGTASGGVAIGKISGENGLSGVVRDTNSKGGKLAARANGKTVYKDSSGKAYTNSTFGSKVEVKQNKDGSWSNKTVDGKSVKYTKEAGVSSGHGTAQEQDNSDNESDSSKIICTAMNASYGFGSYRQAIWLSYSNKHLTKEHEVGYHTLFLPLVHLAYTKDNKLIRKLLEHGTRRRTADIRAELKGTKRNTLGRIYRAVLEPLCYGVGKIKMTLGE